MTQIKAAEPQSAAIENERTPVLKWITKSTEMMFNKPIFKLRSNVQCKSGSWQKRSVVKHNFQGMLKTSADIKE